jgi:hypothetical protein
LDNSEGDEMLILATGKHWNIYPSGHMDRTAKKNVLKVVTGIWSRKYGAIVAKGYKKIYYSGIIINLTNISIFVKIWRDFLAERASLREHVNSNINNANDMAKEFDQLIIQYGNGDRDKAYINYEKHREEETLKAYRTLDCNGSGGRENEG